MPYSYQYPRPALTVDCVVFGFDEGELKVLLIQRGLEPFKGRWACRADLCASRKRSMMQRDAN